VCTDEDEGGGDFEVAEGRGAEGVEDGAAASGDEQSEHQRGEHAFGPAVERPRLEVGVAQPQQAGGERLEGAGGGEEPNR